MPTFADAFIQSYNAEAERLRREDSLKKMFGLLGDKEQQESKVRAANGLYDAARRWDAANPAIKAGGYRLQNPMATQPGGSRLAAALGFGDTGAGNTTPAPGGQFNLAEAVGPDIPKAPSYQDKFSLVPPARQAEPAYDTRGKYEMAKWALDNGIEPGVALPVIGGYFADKRAERRLNDYYSDGMDWQEDFRRKIKAARPYATDREIQDFLIHLVNGG